MAIFISIYLCVNAIYFYLIFGTAENVVFCCDATGYIQQSDRFREEGFAATFPWLGYRSYLNYAVPALLREIGWLLGASHEAMGSGSAPSFSVPFMVGSLLLSTAAGIFLVIAFYGVRGFKRVFIPLMMNPFLFAYLPIPLQESTLVLLASPLVASIILSHETKSRIVPSLIGLLAGLLWMTKSSLSITSISTLFLGIFYINFYRFYLGSRIRQILIITIAFILPIAPQVYSMAINLGTLWPYPNNTLLNQQFAWGWSMWWYDTYYDANLATFTGLRYPSPNPEPSAGFNFFGTVLAHPLTTLTMAAGHLLAAFNYEKMLVYAWYYPAKTFSYINIIVGFIIFLAISSFVKHIFLSSLTFPLVLLSVIAITSLGPLMFVAVEARFTILAFAMFSVVAIGCLLESHSRTERAMLFTGGAMFSIAFMLIGTLMFQISEIPMERP